jgi:hypothetical protein
MEYDKIIAELEAGVDWTILEDVPTKEALEVKAVGLQYLKVLHEQQAEKYATEYDQVSALLAAVC